MEEVKYPIAEIFRSIQGEGYHTGCPAVFIRLAGCNLECPWCDTDHTEKIRLGTRKLTGIVEELHREGDILVITGGEPTIHNLHDLIDQLIYKQVGKICIETNGTDCEEVRSLQSIYTWITVSPKALCYNTRCFRYASEIKVVWDEKDMEYLEGHIPDKFREERKLFLQPCSGDVKPALDYIMEHPWWRLSLQTHKIINVQ